MNLARVIQSAAVPPSVKALAALEAKAARTGSPTYRPTRRTGQSRGARTRKPKPTEE